mmetsp:Transcript_5658/g.9262  ORF Transcript_5658/g.9262 Transcript_5658/m.9262 type:complete len:204 (+) Transcript_5658:441-1052(+)
MSTRRKFVVQKHIHACASRHVYINKTFLAEVEPRQAGVQPAPLPGRRAYRRRHVRAHQRARGPVEHLQHCRIMLGSSTAQHHVHGSLGHAVGGQRGERPHGAEAGGADEHGRGRRGAPGGGDGLCLCLGRPLLLILPRCRRGGGGGSGGEGLQEACGKHGGGHDVHVERCPQRRQGVAGARALGLAYISNNTSIGKKYSSAVV